MRLQEAKTFDLIWVVPSLADLGGTEYLAVTFARLMAADGHRVRFITGTRLHPAWRERLGNQRPDRLEVIQAADDTPAALCSLAENLHAEAPADLIQFLPIEAHCLAWLRRGLPLPVAGWEPTDLGPHVWWLADELAELIHRLDVLLVSNPVAAHHAAQRYGYQGRVQVVPNTVTAPAGTSAANRDSTVPVVGCIARLSAEKGIEYLLGAFSLLLQRLPTAQLALWGDGDDRERLQYLATMLGIASQVRFHGAFDPFRAIDTVAAAADVFVLSSLFEGAPVALLEVAARGRPVVATATSGARWVCGDDYDWLVPVGDTSRLASALAELLASPPLRAEAGAQLQQRCQHHFSAEQAVAALRAACESTIQKAVP
ncbi:Glycosyltransferase involved in cell wall bisynthesis [Rhizobiales bacterium GAS191]|nr:Glycosyltransferase involved in cell wall bisynthesis [Rhizobiales bacterium GAS191]